MSMLPSALGRDGLDLLLDMGGSFQVACARRREWSPGTAVSTAFRDRFPEVFQSTGMRGMLLAETACWPWMTHAPDGEWVRSSLT